jgi:hypothetical protein
MDKLELLKLKFESKEIDSFFDCLTDILLKLSNNTLNEFPDFKKHFSNHMICRYLSMSPKLICYAEYLNKLQLTLNSEQFYHLAYTLVPKQQSGFIKYIKKPKKDKKTEIKDNSTTTLSIFDI